MIYNITVTLLVLLYRCLQGTVYVCMYTYISYPRIHTNFIRAPITYHVYYVFVYCNCTYLLFNILLNVVFYNLFMLIISFCTNTYKLLSRYKVYTYMKHIITHYCVKGKYVYL